MRFSFAIASLPLFLAAASPGAAAEPRYAVAYAKAEFARGEKIGLKKAGLLCLPNGAVRWGKGDFHVDPAELSASVGAGLARTGLSLPDAAASRFGPAAGEAASHLIGFTITAGRFDLCAPKWGLGDRSRLRGTARVAARWEVFSKADQKVVLTAVTEQSVTSEAGDFSALLDILIARSAQEFARKAAAAD
jgi:hypothetical protein